MSVTGGGHPEPTSALEPKVGPSSPSGVGSANSGEAILTRLEDGRIRVDRADPIIQISVELLDQADPAVLRVDADIVKFGDINPVTYRVTERHAGYVIAEKL